MFNHLNIVKYYRVVGTRRVVASMVGAAVVDGREMRGAADDRGPTQANCNKKYNISLSLIS